MKIEVTPSSRLPISIARQQQIIDAINNKLAINPRRGFCFIGAPGTGKTYLMNAIRKAIAVESANPSENLRSRPNILPIVTLADWQDANLDRVRGAAVSRAFGMMTSKGIRAMADNNAMFGRGVPGWNKPYPFETLHIFIDEFDSQPTASEFSSSNLQTFVNAIYENAPRICSGNDQDFCQLVVAMNKSWSEFVATYGMHIARRIEEMCIRVDFDKAAVVEPQPEIALSNSLDKRLEGLLCQN
jgi:hypothetical protein